MTENAIASANEESIRDLRGTLIKRLAVAGVLVAILLGVLAFFDYLATSEEPEAEVFTQPVPVASKKEVSQPVTPTEDLPEPPVAIVPEPVVEAAPASGAEAAAAAVADAKPQTRPENRPIAPSTAASARIPPNVPLVVTLAPTRTPRATPEATAAPTIALDEPVASRAKPPTRVTEARTSPTILPPTVSRLFSGFVLRAGVFTNAQLAEELRAKLTLSGVPSSVESRVQVGPFKTRQEAEAAQVKLKELGIETILLPPKGARP